MQIRLLTNRKAQAVSPERRAGVLSRLERHAPLASQTAPGSVLRRAIAESPQSEGIVWWRLGSHPWWRLG
jgi:hypothetical protein